MEIVDERELLLEFLERQRASVRRAAVSLNEDQARWTPGDRLLPIIGIIHHLTEVEWRWIDGRYLRAPATLDGARPGEPEPGDPEFVVSRDRTLADVLEAYRIRAARTEEVVTGAPGVEAACLGGTNQPPRPGLYLRWVLLHLIEETARHAGHADATRELLDGTTG